MTHNPLVSVLTAACLLACSSADDGGGPDSGLDGFGQGAGGPTSGSGGVSPSSGSGGAVPSSGSGGWGGPNVIEALPHCPRGDTALLRVRGTIDGNHVNIEQQGSDASGGFWQLGQGEFNAPAFVGEPAASLVQVVLRWEGMILDDRSVPIADGTLTLPESHPAGGVSWCVERGEVGIPSDEAQMGSLKFAIEDLRGGDDCLGASVPAEIYGCWASAQLF